LTRHPQEPYQSPHAQPWDSMETAQEPRKHSGLGIASFILAIFAGFTAFALVVTAGVLEASTPGGIDDESPVAIIIGLSLFAIIGVNLLGIALGVAGIFQPNRYRTFPVLGILFNLMLIMAFLLLVVIGLTIAV